MIKNIYKRFKDNFYMTFKYSSFLIFIFFIAFIIITLLLSAFSLNNVFSFLFFVIISSILFGFISPSIYAYFVCNELFDNPKVNVDFKLFIANRKPGKNRMVKSQLRVFSTILLSYIIFIVLTIICLFILSLINKSINNLNSFYGYYNEVMKLSDLNDYNEYSNKLNTLYEAYSEYINKDLSLVNLFSSFGAIYYFIHSILNSLMKYYLINSLPTMQLNNSCYKKALNDPSTNYYKDYYSLVWPYILGFIVIYFGTYLILFYLCNVNNSFVLISSSIMINLFIFMPFFPIILNFNKIKVNLVSVIYFKNYKIFYEMMLEREKNYDEILKRNSEAMEMNKEILDKLSDENNSDEDNEGDK